MKNQPKGLTTLILAQSFESFSYFTMVFLLVLYMTASPDKGGMGYESSHALQVFGYYKMLGVVLNLSCAVIAARFIGYKKSVLIGNFVMLTGHGLMFFSFEYHVLFYVAWFLVALGSAFFVSPLATLVGEIHTPGDTRRNASFNLLYAGLNLGALAASIASGIFAEQYGYHFALGTAAPLMLFSIAVFCYGYKGIVITPEHSTLKVERPAKDAEQQNDSNKQKKSFSLFALLMLFFGFWFVCYHLAMSGTVTLFIEKFTDRTVFGYEIPSTFFFSINTVVILVGVPIANLIALKIRSKDQYSLSFNQIGYGLLLLATSILYFCFLVYKKSGDQSFHWLEISIFLTIFSLSELFLSPTTLSLANAIAPKNYKALFYSIAIAMAGVTAVVAGKLGAIALDSTIYIFGMLAAVSTIATLGYYKMKPILIKLAQSLHS